MNKEELIRTVAFDRIKTFLHYADPEYKNNFHIDEVCKELQAILDGEPRKLLISMPPRHGKSYLISEHFPALFLGRNPKKNIIITGYSDTIATKFVGTMKKIYEKKVQPLSGVRLDKKNNAKTTFLTNEGGKTIGRGLASGLTGESAHLLIIDDPFKNKADAMSPVLSAKIWEGFRTDAYTRIEPGGSCIIIHTRWTDNDLIGRISSDPELMKEFKLINFPAIDPVYPGGALFPARYPLSELKKIKKVLGSLAFNALYQQDPVADGGNIIKPEWINWIQGELYASQKLNIFTSWDLATSEDKTADYTVGTIWYKKGPAEFVLLDMVRGQWDFPQAVKEFEKVAQRYPMATHIVEDKSSGRPLIQTLQKKIPRIVKVNPVTNKVLRVEAQAPLFEAGNVYVANNRWWKQDFLHEAKGFPTTKNDDIIDSVAQALAYMNTGANMRGMGVYIGV